MFKSLLEKTLASPKYVYFGIAVVFLIGLLTASGLKVDLFPPLNFPILNIITEVSSYSSLEMERQVTLPIESAASGVLGVTRVRSTSATGISMVSAEFEWGSDMLMSRQRLIEALSAVRGQLPASSEPTIENLSATLSMIEGYSLQGGEDLVKLRDSALYDLKPRLQRVPGVYKVLIMGGKIAEYSLFPNTFEMIKYDITLDNLKDALVTNNILASPGVVNHDSQELVIHANGQFADETEIADVVISIKNGAPIRVRDIARVSKGLQYERGDTSEKGQPSVLINILKQPNFDTGAVADAVAHEVSLFQKALPAGYTIHNYYDQAQLVGDSIGSVKESVWIGGILVVLVLAFFLRSFRSTLIAAFSIPISIVTALILMRAFGIGLNIMSLGGLAIGTGIIVDDTIVVLENIFRWLTSERLRAGHTPKEVIVLATHEVLRPVVVSTLTNIGIFLPMIFVEGFAGRLFSPVSFTVTFALLASLIVALFIIPVFAEQFLLTTRLHEAHDDLLHRGYKKLLNAALRVPKRVILVSFILVGVISFGAKKLSVEFLPALDEGALLLQTIMPPGTSLDEAKRLNTKIETWMQSVPGVETVVRRTGHAPGAEDTDNVNHSDITARLLPKNKRAVSLEKLIDALKDKTSQLPNVVVNYLMPLADKINDALGGVPADLGVDLFGPDLAKLHGFAETLTHSMEHIAGVSDLRPPSDIPVPALEVQINKKEAGRLGIPARIITDTLQAFSIGLPITSVKEIQKEVSVSVYFSSPGKTLDLESLKGLPLRTAGGSTVPLEQVAELKYGELPSEISHEHLSRKLTLTCNLKGRNATDVAKDVEKAIEALQLPSGYSWGFSGKYQTEQKALTNMLMVLALAIFVVATILWFEFRSFIEVGLILLTLPLAAVGAILSLVAFKESLNVSSMIGAVMLVGIVVRNGIMLLDYLNQELAAGKGLLDAIRGASLNRVRPILMTASVTILGLLPLALGFGTGAELQKPLAIAVVGGIFTSTLLTLLVLPATASLVVRKNKQ